MRCDVTCLLSITTLMLSSSVILLRHPRLFISICGWLQYICVRSFIDKRRCFNIAQGPNTLQHPLTFYHRAGSSFGSQQQRVGWWPSIRAQVGRLVGGLLAVLRWVPGVRRWLPADDTFDGAMRRSGSDLFDRQSGGERLLTEFGSAIGVYASGFMLQ